MSLDNLPSRLILKTGLPPGDILTLTAAVYSLKRAYPQIQVDTRTDYPDIWKGNPDITALEEGTELEANYPLIHKSNQVPACFIHGYCAHLAESLGVPLTLQTNRPHLYIVPGERAEHDLPKPYWLVSAGIKSDFTTKSWPVEYYQEVIDKLGRRVNFVHVGHSADIQPELFDCNDLVGRTSLRELILLAQGCAGGLGPSTLLQHLCAAFQKPYVCLLGGREGKPWQDSYMQQHTLHTLGQLDCCKNGGCWKSKVVDPKDKSLCKHPVLSYSRPVPLCMEKIKPQEVVSIITRGLEVPQQTRRGRRAARRT